ncbi:TetR/AcrR family transcriptional regulator [Acuticoccus sp. M5D2P5]|uniref:TetR/AcrR family transcriptional regulator n=1 Tax=Acuticoccus kalidii TaxID=2910977 RepID=UPI001F40A7BB|nr:TetR/AcrR family transcriptional regulator [Acuticoccus kalidii]MCF3931873.1 TetR/AcrR family transcriptional regulator [Acuticoccus kalidii]
MAEAADRIIDATMRLLAEHPFDEVTVGRIADASGVGLAEMAEHFGTRGEILDGFARRIDRAVLAGDFSDMADEPPRERLFDVLMSRLDALRPYRAAMKSLMRSALRDPSLAMGLNAMEVRSQSWMLAAAGIQATGWRGRVVLQGLAVAFARVLRTFVEEDDAGLPRTMAVLDKELREAERRHRRFARVFGSAVAQSPAAEAEAAPDIASASADRWPEDAAAADSAADGPADEADRMSPGGADHATGEDTPSDDQANRNPTP